MAVAGESAKSAKIFPHQNFALYSNYFHVNFLYVNFLCDIGQGRDVRSCFTVVRQLLKNKSMNLLESYLCYKDFLSCCVLKLGNF